MNYVLFIWKEEKNQKAAMEEAQSLESEIQTAIEKAHEAVKSKVQISAAMTSASQENHATHSSSSIVLEGQLNSGSSLPASQSVQSSQSKAGGF